MADNRPKLSNNQREEILRRFAAGEPVTRLAGDYGVGETSIRKLCTRRVSAERVQSEKKRRSSRNGGCSNGGTRVALGRVIKH